jgi:signal transduction histidine kinase
VKVSARLAVLVFSIFLASYFMLVENDWPGSLLGMFLTIASGVALFRQMSRHERDMARFLEGIAHNDFTTTAVENGRSNVHQSLVQAQKAILDKFRQLAAERSVQTEYLHLVIEHVDTALVCFDDDYDVKMINNAARELFKSRLIPSLHKIASIHAGLARTLVSIRAGEQIIEKVVIDDEGLQLLLAASEFRLLDTNYKLVSLQNVKKLLDEKEIESWQKLIRVINHELMNSMTPILSLSQYALNKLTDKRKIGPLEDRDSEEYRLLQESIEIIHSRCQGLVNFIAAYRGLNQTPRSEFTSVDVSEFFRHIALLLQDKIDDQGIALVIRDANPNVFLLVDESSLEQIIINLIYNAMDSLEGVQDPTISLECHVSAKDKVALQVHDNGGGIKDEHIDNIFTPFFSTKDHSSGIGLSVSRQLAQLNNASLTVHSVADKGSTFTLTFL